MIQLAKGLRLDPDYIGGGTFALLAKKGWGKTYAMRVFAEEFAKATVPFVALDPMDAFWGLRAGKNGAAGDGLSIPIFGGPHADAPLEATAGKLMADLVVDEGLSMVLSLKHFGTRAAEKRFAEDFLERLYRRNSELVHLLIDEADLFAPQKPQQGDQKLLGITENIVRRGRNNGIGVTLGTQRPAVLNKDVLTQVDGLVVGRMLGPNDRNAIDAWVGEHGDTKKGKTIKDELPELATGECWVWIPEQGVLKRVTIREARTFDSSPTRKRGAKAREPKALADIDFGAIKDKMADTIERAKAEDPKELRKQIVELQRQLAERPDAPAAEPIEVPVLDDDAMTSLRALLAQVDENVGTLPELFERLLSGIDVALTEGVRAHLDRAEKLVGATRAPKVLPKRAGSSSAPSRSPLPSAAAARPASPPPASAAPDGDPPALKKAERRILNVLAQFPDGRTKVQVAILTGYSAKSGGFRNALGVLRSAGYAVGGDPIQITQEGLTAAGDIEPLPIGRALLEHWLGSLKKAERVILEILYEHTYALSKEEIAALAEYSPTSGGFRNALGRLRSLELIEGRDAISISEVLR